MIRSLNRTRIYEELRGDIVKCRIRPGSVLQEKDLAERMGVSRSPVRDALLKLEEHGLIEIVPRKGYRVRQISISDARELYEMRHIVERECILRLIEYGSDECLKELDQFRAPIEPTSIESWMEQNRMFHRFFAIHCGNRRLTEIALGIHEHFDRLTLVGVSSRSDQPLKELVAEHCHVIDAVQARNRRRAAALIRDHIEASRARIMALLEGAAILA
jgi:DNA-binding GntR family transcriptional regulator